MDDSTKINYLFKKNFNKPFTQTTTDLITEPNDIFGNTITTQPIMFLNNIFRDSIPNIAPSTNTNNVKKHNKNPMNYIEGSMKLNPIDNSITTISFYLDLLQKSIPYNYDPNGSYCYSIFYSNNIEIDYSIIDFILDQDTGILTFLSNPNINIDPNHHISDFNSPRVTFYTYTGVIGLSPFTFNNNNINITSNLNISENLNVKNSIIDDLYIQNNLNIKKITFDKQPSLPVITNNQLIYSTDNLYFYHNSQWLKLINEDQVSFNNEQFIYNSSINNIINVNTNVSIIELNENLTDNAFIILPNIQKTGIEKTIIMGQSVSQYINGHYIIIYSNYIDVDGNGPIYMNIKFVTSGQSLKLLSVNSTTNTLYGYGNKYWQIISGHFNSEDTFSYVEGQLVNNNDRGTNYNNIVNDSQYEDITALHNNQVPDSLLFNTFNNASINLGAILINNIIKLLINCQIIALLNNIV